PPLAAFAESAVRHLRAGLGIRGSRHRQQGRTSAAEDRCLAALPEPRRRRSDALADGRRQHGGGPGGAAGRAWAQGGLGAGAAGGGKAMSGKLGDILISRGVIDAEMLIAALSDQRAFGGKLG